MKTPIRITLLALLFCLVGTAHAQAKWVGDRGAMAGELAALSPVSESVWHTYPLEWPSGQASVTAKISIRYRMWKLIGEPVWTFEPKIEFGVITLGKNSIQKDAQLGPNEVQGGLYPDGSTHIRVGAELFNKVRLRDMFFSARFVQLDSSSSYLYKNGWASGVFERQGEWGWDVPASPSWKQTFTYQGDPLAKGEEITRWSQESEAKAFWAKLESAWKAGRNEPLEYLRCYRLKLDLSSLYARIEQLSPGITRPLFDRILPGETAEQAADRNALEYQIQSMLNGATRGLEGLGSGDSGDSLGRRFDITKKALELLSEPRQDLVEQLEATKQEHASREFNILIKGVARILATDGSEKEGAPTLNVISQKISDIHDRMGAATGNLAPSTLRRMESLKSLNFGMRVVAEWMGPSNGKTYDAQTQLKEISTGLDGRVLALFKATGEDYLVVDALTGEVRLSHPGGLSGLVLVGNAQYAVSTMWKEGGAHYAYSRVDLKTGGEKEYPWEYGDFESWCGDFVVMACRHDGGSVEAWDLHSDQKLWSVGGFVNEHIEATIFRDRWVMVRKFGRHGGAVIDGTTGKTLFTLRDDTWGGQFGKDIPLPELEAELLRRLGESPRDKDPLPTLPPGYDLKTLKHRWNKSFDTLLVVKPGSKPNKAGEVRYQLLR